MDQTEPAWSRLAPAALAALFWGFFSSRMFTRLRSDWTRPDDDSMSGRVSVLQLHRKPRCHFRHRGGAYRFSLTHKRVQRRRREPALWPLSPSFALIIITSFLRAYTLMGLLICSMRRAYRRTFSILLLGHKADHHSRLCHMQQPASMGGLCLLVAKFAAQNQKELTFTFKDSKISLSILPNMHGKFKHF